MIELQPKSTALVLIDLQQGILGFPLAPRSGGEVLAGAVKLAAAFRSAGAPVVLVNVAWSADFGDALKQPVSRPAPAPEGGLPANWAELGAGLQGPGDILVTKRQWGAFHGTELDLQLRRRGVKTIVLGGIATNMGVESTARQAYEHGYDLVVLEDLTSSLSPEMHAFAFETIMPLISIVTPSREIKLADPS